MSLQIAKTHFLGLPQHTHKYLSGTENAPNEKGGQLLENMSVNEMYVFFNTTLMKRNMNKYAFRAGGMACFKNACDFKLQASHMIKEVETESPPQPLCIVLPFAARITKN